MDTDSVLDRIVNIVADGEGVEDLVRPFLRVVESLTGLEATYLTTVRAWGSDDPVRAQHDEPGPARRAAGGLGRHAVPTFNRGGAQLYRRRVRLLGRLGRGP